MNEIKFLQGMAIMQIGFFPKTAVKGFKPATFRLVFSLEATETGQ